MQKTQKITLTQPTNAPNFCFEIVADDGRTVFIQTDWEYPPVASSFGWSINAVQKPRRRCEHSGDGTVACNSCGLTPSDFISAAYDWLVDNVGASVDDPGYFIDSD